MTMKSRPTVVLSASWNPDDPIKDLWLCISNARAIAECANEPITIETAMRLTLSTLEKTGVFETALHDWRVKDDADKTYDNFQEHFTLENDECLCFASSLLMLLDTMEPTALPSYLTHRVPVQTLLLLLPAPTCHLLVQCEPTTAPLCTIVGHMDLA